MITVFFQLAVLIILFGVTIVIYRKQPQTVKSYFWSALILKMAAGLVLGYIYFYHYGYGDTITYWMDGKTVAQKILNDPLAAMQFLWEDNPSADDLVGLINDKPRSLFFGKIAGVLALMTAGNYLLMSIFISGISFLAAWYAFRKLIVLLPASKVEASVAFLYFPSMVFWSSGLIKESLGLASLFILSGFFLSFYCKQRPGIWEWVAALLFFWMGWNLKYYWMGIFIPAILTTAIVVQLGRWKPDLQRIELILWAGFFIFFLLGASGLHPNFYPGRILDVIWENNQEFMHLTAHGNAIYFNNLQPEFSSMAANAPSALLAGIFRPLIWESHNLFSTMAAIENSMVLLLAISAATTIRQWISSPHRMLTMAVLVFAVMLAIFLALSTPNLGTLSRYKIGFMPFLIFLILYRNPAFVWVARRLPLVLNPHRDKT